MGRELRGWGQQGVRAPARLAWADTGDRRPARHRARTWADTGTGAPFPGAWPWGRGPVGRRGPTQGGAWRAPCPPADSNLKHELSRLNLFARRADVSGAGRATANERAAGGAPPPPAMEPAATSIQVLLQAAEFLEHREHRNPLGLAEAEHGYAALCPAPSRRAVGSVR